MGSGNVQTVNMLTPTKVAEILSVSLSTVYSLIEAGKITHYRLGQGRGAIRIEKGDLDLFLASRRHNEKAEPPKKRPRARLKHIKL